MISYQRDEQQTIPDSEVIIVGLGGAGANIIDRVALDGMEDAQQLALNTDSRTLARTVAKHKIQMGSKLTRGLGCGGDPELGLQAAMEVEDEIRDAIRGHKMVFVCVGLGGGTGSGGAPLVTRIARELGAFVVVFSTMPFNFEGRRRREQAETSLNELSVLANALVTFDNGRMGELVLASQGIHEAFSAADNMISESIRAVTRLVIKPGLINVGLDDLMSSLRATRSRCLFGSGIATGENRSQKALKNALNSPLLDKGRLLKNTQTALVHVCGGSEMTLYEVELLMRELSKTVPKEAHILFGAAVDDTMGDSLSITIISSLPEEHVIVNGEDEANAEKEAAAKKKAATKREKVTPAVAVAAPVVVAEKKIEKLEPELEPEKEQEEQQVEAEVEEAPVEAVSDPEVVAEVIETIEDEDEVEVEEPQEEIEAEVEAEAEAEAPTLPAVAPPTPPPAPPKMTEVSTDAPSIELETEPAEQELISEEVEPEPEPESEQEEPQLIIEEKQRAQDPIPEPEQEPELEIKEEKSSPPPSRRRKRRTDSQQELLLDGAPRGKFEGEQPNLVEGEDLDIPAFLRRKK